VDQPAGIPRWSGDCPDGAGSAGGAARDVAGLHPDGRPRGTLASIAFIAPPFLLVVALGWVYVGLGGAPWVGSLFYGIAPAAIAIIALAAYRLLPLTVGRDPLLWAVGLGVGLLTYFTEGEVAVPPASWSFSSASVPACWRAPSGGGSLAWQSSDR
jgi:Chromate transporter